MAKRSTKDEFVEKARKIHGDTYRYDNLVYVNDRTRVVITCQKHGDFEQIATNHLRGKGCSKCSIDRNLSIRQSLFIMVGIFMIK